MTDLAPSIAPTPHAGRTARTIRVIDRVLAVVCLVATGCTHPLRGAIETYVCSNGDYARLPRGPERVDALWAHARSLTGSDTGALRLLGSIAVQDGLRLRHPFSTGLTSEGVLAPDDKSGHFFAQAMWSYYDHYRLIPIAEINSIAWEIVGEIRYWFGKGVGFDWRDIWANRLGREFGKRIYAKRHRRTAGILPSAIIADADRFRPAQIAPAGWSQAKPQVAGTRDRCRMSGSPSQDHAANQVDGFPGH